MFKLAIVLVLGLGIFFRFYKLDSLPPSLYWEEAALGYDAYSIAQTGRDHHNNPWPLAAFESFGDWKPAGYFYALVPFVKMFGLSSWVVRLPSAISGIAIILGVGLLVYQLAKLQKKSHALRVLPTLPVWMCILTLG
ncbi:unnamed protein product, partial [marine sediment metagenome]